MTGLLETGIEVVERDERHDGDAETERGRDERLRDAARDDRGGLELAVAEQAERADHARDRAEETEERRERDDGVEDGESPVETLELPPRRVQKSPGKRFGTVLEAVGERTRHEVP